MKLKKLIAAALSCAAVTAAFCPGHISAAAEQPDLENDYVLLDWEPAGNCYWNSADPSLYNELITIENKPSASNIGMFVSSGRMFTREDIPVGSYIQIDAGYQYRPEAWTAELGKNDAQDRPGNVTAAEICVDEAWWGESEYKAFNVSRTDSSQIGNIVGEIRDVFRIYVPKNGQGQPTDTPTEPAGEPTEPADTPYVPDDTLKILAIGNSFSEDAMEYLYNIATHSGVEKVVLGNLFIGGGTLQQHWNNLNNETPCTLQLRNGSNAMTALSRTLQSAVAYTDWDIITLQQGSGSSGMPDTYEPYLSELIDFVKDNAINPNMKLGWHMTWAYQQDTTHNEFYKYDRDQMTMYNAIVDTVKKKVLTSGEFDFIIPSGTAVQNMRTSFAGDMLTRDGYHMGYVLGRYMIGLTWFKAVTSLSVEGLSFDGITLDSVEWEPMTVGDKFKTVSASPFDWVYISDEALGAVKEAVNNAFEEKFSVTQSSYAEYTGDRPYIISQTDINGSKAGAVFTKIGDTAGSDTAAVAVYDADGKLIKLDTREIALEKGGNTTVEVSGAFSKGYSMKAFVFDDLSAVKPLGAMAETAM